MGLPPTKLLLRLTEQLLHVQQMVFVETTFPSTVKHSVLYKYKHVYYVTNCSTEVGEHPILFFLFFVEESSKRAAKTIACPCRKHVRGYTAGVCLNTNICLTHAPQRVARSRIVLSLFLQPIFRMEYASMTALVNFQFSEAHKIFLLGCRRSPEIRNPPNFSFQEF